MPTRSATPVHRAVLQKLAFQTGSTAWKVPNAAGTANNVDVNFRFVGEAVRTKNPTEARYPGWSVQIDAPRPNDDWTVYGDTVWSIPDPGNTPDGVLIKHAEPQQTFWLDYRIALYAKMQHQFDALVANLWRVFAVGKGQRAISWPDDDDPLILHTAQVRIRLLINRFRPADNVFLADYLLTVPTSLVLSGETVGPPIEEFVLSLGVQDDPGPPESSSQPFEP